jgi:hypothetical protein
VAERIRLSRAKGWRLPANTVVVSRPGKWGNPFVVGRDGTQAQCVGLFIQLARGFISFCDTPDVDTQMSAHRRIRRSIASLRGKNLACWCALDKPCHADVLLHLANPDMPLPATVPREIELPRVRLGMAAQDVGKLRRLKTQEAAHG